MEWDVLWTEEEDPQSLSSCPFPLHHFHGWVSPNLHEYSSWLSHQIQKQAGSGRAQDSGDPRNNKGHDLPFLGADSPRRGSPEGSCPQEGDY